jgi:hypothetical protein
MSAVSFIVSFNNDLTEPQQIGDLKSENHFRVGLQGQWNKKWATGRKKIIMI